jgi:hypothetical protein
VALRGELVLADPLTPVLAFLESYGAPRDDALPGSFGERDLREANRGGARIAAVEIAAVLERRAEIERALQAVPVTASLARRSVPWPALKRLFEGFAEIRGVGFSKMTKTLHPKRPALIPMLDSVVQRYLAEGRPLAAQPFGERATELVSSYKQDLDRNRIALRELSRELAGRGYRLTEVRILDMLIWSAFAEASLRG